MTFDVLGKYTKIDLHCVLEASAGTGKTFSIQHIALRLLLEKKIPLEQLLLVTFTKASTRELHTRLRKNVEDVLKSYKKNNFLFPYMENCPRDEAMELLETALTSFEDAAVYTIHGFCHELLKEHAFSLGLSLDMAPQQEKVQENIRKEFVRKYLYALDKSTFHPLEVRWAFQGQATFSKIYALLETLVQEKTSSKDLPSIHADFLEKAARFPFWNKVVEELEESISDYYPSYRKQGRELRELLTEVPFLRALATGDLSLDNFAMWIDFSPKVFAHFEESNRKKKALRGENPLEKLSAFANAHLTSLFLAAKEQRRILERIALDMQQSYERFLEEKQDISPDQLLHLTHSLLKNSQFLEKTREQYQAVIIDESQDTDPVQWEIFHTLFFGKVRAFYLVGDPKQSIYGFRKADIYTYLQASEAMEQRFFLQTNYRSEQALMAGLNRFFLRRKDWLYLPKLGKKLSYHEVYSPQREKSSSELLFWLVFAESGRGAWPSREIEEKYFYPEIVKKLHQARQKHPKGTQAILVKDRFQGERMRLFLQKQGISSSFRSSLSIVDSPMFTHFFDVLKAVRSPSSETAVKKALLTPFFGLSVFSGQLLEKESICEAKELFISLQKELVSKGFARFLPLFLSTVFSGTSVQERLASTELLGEAREIVEHFMETSLRFPFSLEQMELFFDEAKLLEEKATPSDEEAVQILTIHASKGLEFDLVIPIGLLPRPPSQKFGVEEIDAEKFRQLYVALTRAKKFLYVPILLDLAEKPPLAPTASIMELFISHFVGKSDLYEGLSSIRKEELTRFFSEENLSFEILEPAIPPSFVEDSSPVISYLPKPFFQEKVRKIHSFSSLNEGKVAQEKLEIPIEKNKLPAGKETGILLHSLLEKNLRKRKIDWNELLKDPLPPLYEPYRTEIQKLIEMALQVPFFQGGPSASALGFVQKQIEMEFAFSMKEETYKGFIDLLFFHEDRWYIVDWKSNYLGERLGAYNEEALFSYAKKKGYDLQANMYKIAVEKHLAFHGIKGEIGGIFFVFLRGNAAILPWKEKGATHVL